MNKNLEEFLDVNLTKVIDEARKTHGADQIRFAGTVSGFLIKTGIALAARNGAPRPVLEEALARAVQDWYGKN
jgi:hypothetical protein